MVVVWVVGHVRFASVAVVVVSVVCRVGGVGVCGVVVVM